jgi:Zn finger protein HypA/HybF involved in hydrogenase expression
VIVKVECRHCGAAYETEAPVEAVRLVKRCQECGQRALKITEEREEREPRPTPQQER